MNFPNSTALLQKAEEASLYEKLVSQIRKDFGLANIYIDLPEGILPKALVGLLREKIYYLIMERFSEYLNLLYVVDIPEREFRKIQVTDVVEVAEQVVFLLLNREMQKVWLKQKYSG
ncbi:hypothetical protein [Pseudozobellia thermophila]|uniref:Uncharacterized protein n=1 Tax=Pseudozobellia thermophila TaxID=192903 RepID=A0A1M6KF16_9FLAO|nr:hypothetical protein [Pseudozobellia thermophila]SHJ57509.1 hypothetical protein SAMN04488513_10639 [Pseudozobellia thermophila]